MLYELCIEVNRDFLAQKYAKESDLSDDHWNRFKEEIDSFIAGVHEIIVFDKNEQNEENTFRYIWNVDTIFENPLLMIQELNRKFGALRIQLNMKNGEHLRKKRKI